MKSNVTYHSHGILMIAFVALLASVGAMFLSIFKVIGEEMNLGLIVILGILDAVLLIIMVICIPPEVRYTHCIRHGHKTKGSIIKVEEEYTRGSGISHYIIVKYVDGNQEESAARLHITVELLRHVSGGGKNGLVGQDISLLVYKDCAIIDPKGESINDADSQTK